MSKNTVCWLDIPVTDLNRAAAFYSAVLGASVKAESSDGHEYALLPGEIEKGAVTGCLTKMEDAKPSKDGPLVYLSVEGRLDAAADAAKSSGGTILKEKHQIGPYGYRAVVVDSEGNRIALHSQGA